MQEYNGEVVPISDGLRPYDGDIIPIEQSKAGGGRGSVNPSRDSNEFARGNASRGPSKGIIASVIDQPAQQEESYYDPTGTIPQEVVDARKPAYVGDAGRGSAEDPRRFDNITPGEAFVNAADRMGTKFSNLGRAVAAQYGLADDDATTEAFRQMQEDEANAAHPRDTVGKIAEAIPGLLPVVAAAAVNPVLGATVGAAQFGADSGMSALDQGKSLDNARAKAAINAVLGTTAVNKVLGPLGEVASKLPIPSDTIKHALTGAATGEAFAYGGRAADYGVDAATGEVDQNADGSAKGLTDYLGEVDPLVAAAPLAALGAAHHVAPKVAGKVADKVIGAIDPNLQAAREMSRTMDSTDIAGSIIKPVSLNPNLAEAKSVDEAISAATTSVPHVNPDAVKAQGDLNVANTMEQLRSVDQARQDRIAKDEFDNLNSKVQSGEALDVNEQQRYNELKNRFLDNSGGGGSGIASSQDAQAAGGDLDGASGGSAGRPSGETLREQPTGVLSSPEGDAGRLRFQEAFERAKDERVNSLITNKQMPESAAKAQTEQEFGSFNDAGVHGEDRARGENLVGLLSAVTGLPPDQFHLVNDSARENGLSFVEGGKAHTVINLGDPTMPVSATGWHEVLHTLKRTAAIDTKNGLTDTPAQRFTDRIDNLLSEFTLAGKREYVREFLHQSDVRAAHEAAMAEGQQQGLQGAELAAFVKKAGDAVVNKHVGSDHTHEEMQADLMGKLMNDPEFVNRVASKDPVGFKKFAQDWLKFLSDMIANAKKNFLGSGGNAQSRKIDQHVKDIERAKDIVEDALLSLRDPVRMQEHSDGTVSFHGADHEAIADALRGAGVEKLTVMPGDGGVRVGKTESAYAKDLHDSGVMMSRRDLNYDYDAALGAKFERMRRFYEHRQTLLDRIHEDARNGREEAAIMRLIAHTGFRIGGDGVTQGEPTFGASNLKPEHVTINGDTIHFNFRGKSGVQQSHSIVHPEIAADLQQRLGGERVFGKAARAVRKYHDRILSELFGDAGDYKVHDYRTYKATNAAQRVVDSLPAPKTPEELKAAIKLAAEEAGRVIGDDHETALKSYVDPTIFDKWKSGVERVEPGVQESSGEGKARSKKAGDVGADGREDGSPVRKSGKDDFNELGAFDLDSYDHTDADYLTDAEIQAKIKAELADELYGVKEAKPLGGTQVHDFGTVRDKDIKAAGLHPESAYPDLEYKDSAAGGKFARFKVNGQEYLAEVKERKSPGISNPESGATPIRDMNKDAKGQALPHGMQNMSEKAKMEWNKRFATQADLIRRRFDLYTSVPSEARQRVADVWNKIAKNPDAFEFAKDVKPTGKNIVEVAQSIADQIAGGGRYKITARALSGDNRMWYSHGVELKIHDTKTRADSEAVIQYNDRTREVVMHTQDLEKGSGAGKPVYQIGQLFAQAFRSKIHADPNGLLGVNNYRRTEQMFSGMLRSGNPETMQPGVGQRIYGWNERAKTPEHHERNMVRTALAIARNVSELFPQIKDVRYDMQKGEFLYNDGGSAENLVKGVLESPDARAMSLSRSTLARAAITHEAIAGDVKVPDKMEAPVLYAKKQGPDELKYEKNYLVPEIEGFKDGNIAHLPAIIIGRDGIKREYPAMPVRIRVGEHQRGEKFSEQYGLQHRIENKQQYEYRGYKTPEVGSDSASEVERAARDITLGVLTGKTVYADTSASKIYLFSPSENIKTVLKKETDSEGNPFWSVQSSMPSTREQMNGAYKAPTTINGIVIGKDGTQQATGSLTGILDKLREPGSFHASSESYILDHDNKLFNEPVAKTATPVVKKSPVVLQRGADGKIILNKKKIAAPEEPMRSAKEQTDTPQFKRWFGDSEMVNSEGDPRIMYHGTGASFNEFKAKQAGAIFVTDHPEFADGWADMSAEWMNKRGMDGAQNVMPVYVKASKIFDLQDAKSRQLAAKFTDDPQVLKLLERGTDLEDDWNIVEQPKLQAAIRAAGFDGFAVRESGFKNYAVYSSNQIKSAIGNSGDFDASNPDIRYSGKQTETPEFKRWFGSSKVVDADGNPLVVYHGTNAARAISKFNGKGIAGWFAVRKEDADSYAKLRAELKYESNRSKYKDEASIFANNKTYETFLSIKNPVDLQGVDMNQRIVGPMSFDTAKPNGSISREGNAEWKKNFERIPAEDRFDLAREYAYKLVEPLGIKMGPRTTKDYGGYIPTKVYEVFNSPDFARDAKAAGYDGIKVNEDGQETWAAFDPSQIKSATDNRGTFDPEDPRITHSLKQRFDDATTSLSKLIDEGLDEKTGIYGMVAPMSAGSDRARAMAQQWINNTRKAEYEWKQIDKYLTDHFDDAQRMKMFNAADEQNELLSTGQSTAGKGLDTLAPDERAAMDMLHKYGEELLQRAKDVGMFKGEGVPYWTPRMMAMVDPQSGDFVSGSGKMDSSSSGQGRNFTTSSSNLKQRKYLTADETEAAMAKMGGMLVRDIRTMPMAMAKLEKAIAGRELVNQIKDVGYAVGEDFAITHEKEGYFTLDHPAFQTFKPRLQEVNGKWETVKDQDGNIIFDKQPIYISKEFEGPLKAILSEKSGDLYKAFMLLKSKSMSAIMFSPFIHQLVIAGRAFAYAGVKLPALYIKGLAVRRDVGFMKEMIGAGMVPIGGQHQMLDIGDIARGIGKEGGWLDPNESWIGLGAQKIGNTIKGGLGDKLKSGIDVAGNFWHNTLLWDRVGDLQAGIAKDVYTTLLKKGADDATAKIVAAHIANRYSGAIGRENMSVSAHRFANVLLFSKSFNMGNIGSVKDVLYGLPAGLKATLVANASGSSSKLGMSYAKRKAMTGLVLDFAATILATSLVQDWWKRNKDSDWKTQLSEGLDGYEKRAADMWLNLKDHPLSMTSYNPYRLSSTWNNEPDKRDRVDMGPQPNSGRHEYMRLPTGKVVEDIYGWTMHPTETLGKKLSPAAGAVKALATNDKTGYGTPIYDPDDTMIHKAMDIAKFLVGKQLPADQIQTAKDVYSGVGTELDKDKLVGNMTGFTVSQGHPRGPEGAVNQKTEDRMKIAKAKAMEEVKRDLKYGDEEAARARLEELQFTPKEVNLLIRNLQNPRDRLTGQQRKKFNAHANEEERAYMDSVGR